MKKNIKYLVMAAVALLSMSACTNEMDEQNAANGGELQPVQFQMVTTRTVTDAVNRVTSWKVGDAIGIFALPVGTTDIANAKAANAKYVLGSDNVWKAEEGSEIYPEEALDYYAYYPYQEGVTNPAAINISAKADQSMANGDDYGASDVLAGQTKNVAAGQGNVTLIFKHMFAMVEVKVEGDKVTKQPAKVELKGVKLDAVLDIMAATPAATVKTEAEAKDIPMFYLAREGNAEAQVRPFSFRAVVPEQEIAGNTPLVAIYAPDADNKTYTMQHAEAVPYKAGVFRQLNVNIGSSKVSLTIPAGDLTISPWEPSDAIGGEGGEVIPNLVSIPISSLTESITDFVASSNWETAMRNPANTADSQWYTINDNNTLTTSIAAGAITITKTSQGAWNKGVVGFHYVPKAEETQITSGYYKLLVKASAVGGGQLRVFIRSSYMGDPDGEETEYTNSYNWYYPEANKISANVAITLTEDQAVHSRIFDFTKVTSNSSGNGDAATIASTNGLTDIYKFFDIRLFPNVANKSYTIYDVKLEPCEAPATN